MTDAAPTGPAGPTPPPEKRNAFTRFLDGVEWLGNLLPHPVTLFAILALSIVLLSGLFGWMGVAVEDPRPLGAAGRAEDGMITAVSLMNGDGLRRIFTGLVGNFTSFAPLGVVLVAMLGIGVAERSGLLSAAVRALVLSASPKVVTVAIVFAGVISNTASEVGYVVLIPLAGAVYYSLGRHPLAGMAAAISGVAGGFSANLLVTPLDPLLAGLTQAAAQILEPTREVKATANYFLMIAMVPLFTAVGWWITDRMVEPRLNAGTRWQLPGAETARGGETLRVSSLGLWFAGLVALGLIALFASLSWEPGTPFRGDDGSFEPLLRALVAILFVTFLLCGLAYGIAASTIRSDKDAVGMMGAAMSDMGAYIVLAFFAAIFIALFTWSNLGVIMSVNGAQWLKGMGLVGLPLLVAIVFVAAGINILIGSASAKWAIMAPVLVPMLMQLDIDPEWTQAAYRLGDSMTNPITPLMSYFPLILITARRYVPDAGIGSLVALMLPYSIWFGFTSTALFALWFAFGLPLGPGG